MRRLAGLAVLALLVGGCRGSEEKLTVFAAASLTDVFEELDPDATFNFAGSDELATQLREGAVADVYAAASPRYPEELLAEGLVSESRVFATNRLVIVVPSDNSAGIESVADLRDEGVRFLIAAEGVPVGDYTRAVLEGLGDPGLVERAVSQEEDVRSVLAKVALGEADAGFVYATDVAAGGDDVRAVELPNPGQVEILYPIAIVTGAEHRSEAEAFVELVLDERGRAALAAAGFGLP